MSLVQPTPPPDEKLPKLTLAEIFPVVPKKASLTKSGLLWPGLVTGIVGCFLFYAKQGTGLYLKVVAYYLIFMVVSILYLTSGTHRRLFSLIYAAAVTVFIISAQEILDAFVAVFKTVPNLQLPKVKNFLPNFSYYFVVAGLMEELIKAVPALIGLVLGLLIVSPRNVFTRLLDRISVRRPIDGVLMGIAAGGSFTLYETLYKFIPAAIALRKQMIENSTIAQVGKLDAATAKVFMQLSQFAAEKAGVSEAFFLLIPRVLASIAGHMSYAALFGYFIGLAALRRSKIALLLAIGWLLSAALHGSWDASKNGLLLALIATMSFLAFLVYFLKAKSLAQEEIAAPAPKPASI